jgi:hypothetical protein
MADKQAIFYPHRLNRDGSFDSICLTCFATVVYAKTEAELVDSDKDHVCDSGFLAERGLLRQSTFDFRRKVFYRASPFGPHQ